MIVIETTDMLSSSKESQEQETKLETADNESANLNERAANESVNLNETSDQSLNSREGEMTDENKSNVKVSERQETKKEVSNEDQASELNKKDTSNAIANKDESESGKTNSGIF